MSSTSKTAPTWIRKVGHEFDPGMDVWRHVTGWAKTALLTAALQRNRTVFEVGKRGCIEGEDFDNLRALLDKYSKEMTLGRTDCLDTSFDEAKKGTTFQWTFWDEETYFHICLDIEDESSMEGCSVDASRLKKIYAEFLPLFQKRSARTGRVHLLEAGPDGIAISELGKGGEPFLRENYDTQVVEDFDYVLGELTEEKPSGRLFILDGPPGTGKTFFVRGLLDATKDAVFLLVPSRQIQSLSDPSFMPVIRHLHEKEDVPIILILEDADDALLPRDVTNMSTISDLLNFADGIIGSIVDMRILATTNAKNMQIEPALKRKRRLGRAVSIGKLSGSKAEEVFNRLKNEKSVASPSFSDNKYTLAEVYALADGDSVEEETTDKRSGRTGF